MSPIIEIHVPRWVLNNSATQWDWILKTAKNSIFFFDPKQQVRATGLGAERRDQMMDRLENEGTEVYTMELSTQMRVQGGDEYLDFIYDILTGGPTAASPLKNSTASSLLLPYRRQPGQNKQTVEKRHFMNWRSLTRSQISKSSNLIRRRNTAFHVWLQDTHGIGYQRRTHLHTI